MSDSAALYPAAVPVSVELPPRQAALLGLSVAGFAVLTMIASNEPSPWLGLGAVGC